MSKVWIILGHNMSEESGMQEMADWLRPIVPEVKVQHVRAARSTGCRSDPIGDRPAAIGPPATGHQLPATGYRQ